MRAYIRWLYPILMTASTSCLEISARRGPRTHRHRGMRVFAATPCAAAAPASAGALDVTLAAADATAPALPADAATADRATTDAADAALYATLNARRAAVDEGAGRRYRVDNASPGFLNVHTAPDDPFRTDNVVARLLHNDVVESVGERGAWVEHDGGGWSIREYGGHRYLVPVND